MKRGGASLGGSYRDLKALAAGDFSCHDLSDLQAGGPLAFHPGGPRARDSRTSFESGDSKPKKRRATTPSELPPKNSN